MSDWNIIFPFHKSEEEFVLYIWETKINTVIDFSDRVWFWLEQLSIQISICFRVSACFLQQWLLPFPSHWSVHHTVCPIKFQFKYSWWYSCMKCLWISFLKYSHFLPWISKEIKLGKRPLKWKVFIISWTGMNTAQIYLDSYNQNVVQIPFLSLGFLADQSESETKSSMPLDTQMFFFLWMCSFSHRYLISTV